MTGLFSISNSMITSYSLQERIWFPKDLRDWGNDKGRYRSVKVGRHCQTFRISIAPPDILLLGGNASSQVMILVPDQSNLPLINMTTLYPIFFQIKCNSVEIKYSWKFQSIISMSYAQKLEFALKSKDLYKIWKYPRKHS